MSGNVCGYVVRGEIPIANAAITIVEGPASHVDLSPLTDVDGWFALDDLHAGRWSLQAHGPDGATGEADVDVWDDSLSDVTITLDDANPPRADIWPEPDRANPDFQPYDRDGSDEDALLAGAGPEPARTSPAPGVRKKRAGARRGSILGWVTDAVTGAAVADALVMVTDGPGPLPDLAVITDAEGGFKIPGMEPGDWSLRVDANDSGRGELVVAVRSGRRVDVTIAVAQ